MKGFPVQKGFPMQKGSPEQKGFPAVKGFSAQSSREEQNRLSGAQASSDGRVRVFRYFSIEFQWISLDFRYILQGIESISQDFSYFPSELETTSQAFWRRLCSEFFSISRELSQVAWSGRCACRVGRSAPRFLQTLVRRPANFSTSRRARYGLRGVRVGEASHPGPVNTRASAARQAEDADAAEAVLRSEAWRAGGGDLATRAAFRCSALTVPLVWAAARGDAGHEVLLRLCALAPSSEAAARSGYTALGRALRARGVHSEDDLAQLLSEHAGVGRVEAGARFGHVGQRWLLDRAVETDGEVANLEAAYDAAVQELESGHARPQARQPAAPPAPAAPDTSEAPAAARPPPRHHEDPQATPSASLSGTARRRRLTLLPTTRGWEPLDSLDLAAEYRVHVRCLQGVPAFLRGQLRGAYRTSLTRLREAYGNNDDPNKARAWKLFRLTSRMLLWRTDARSPSAEELERRLARFHNQEWVALIREAREAGSESRRLRSSGGARSERRRQFAEPRCPRAGKLSAPRPSRQETPPLCASSETRRAGRRA